ncbi:UNVERIFIED_CONTAM: hypothetical protein GTU68_000735, partial [Idotea baltica]|nr:hypothetical protein [Idotea baltica]
MLKEFKDFIMKGNVLELAVAVIIAAAFGAIVSSFTKDIIMPPIGMAMGGVDFTELAMTLQEAEIRYGAFIQKVIDFLIIAFIIFMLVRTYNKSQERNKEPE